MEDLVHQQRINDYQNRVADWVGRQGLFFQLRHASSIGRGSLLRKLGSFFLTLTIILILIGAVSYVILLKYLKSGSYSNSMASQLERHLSAEELEFSGFERSSGRAAFKDIEVVGGNESFFFDGKMSLFTAPVSFLSGLTVDWLPPSIKIQKADFEIKAGGGEEVSQAFDKVIASFDQTNGLENIEVVEASFDWGYSKLAYGRVEGSQLSAFLNEGRWDISLTGGTFQQNWLQNFTIESAEISLTRTGILIESLKLKLQDGTLDLNGTIAGTPQVPEFELFGEFEQLPVEKLMQLPGVRMQDYLSGFVSGTLKIEGSTDRIFTTTGEVILREGNVITVREKWDIFRTLSLLDKYRDYRRVNFTSGSFKFSTGHGGMELSEIDLHSTEDDEKFMSIKGSLKTHLPDQQEAAAALGITLTNGFGDGFEENATDLSSGFALESERISLKKATGGGKKVNDFGASVIDKGAKSNVGAAKEVVTSEDLDSKRLKAEMNVHRLKGEFSFGIQPNAFESYPALESIHREVVDGLRIVDVKIDGSFKDGSVQASELLLKQSKKARTKLPSQ